MNKVLIDQSRYSHNNHISTPLKTQATQPTDQDTDYRANDFRMRTEESRLYGQPVFVDHSSNISFNRAEVGRADVEEIFFIATLYLDETAVAPVIVNLMHRPHLAVTDMLVC